MKLYTNKENEGSMAVIPRLFSPSSSKNLLSFPSSYDSSLKLQALLQIFISTKHPLPPLLSRSFHSSFCVFLPCFYLPQQATTGSTIAPLSKYGTSDHQHGRMFLVSFDAVSSQQKRPPPLTHPRCRQLLQVARHYLSHVIKNPLKLLS